VTTIDSAILCRWCNAQIMYNPKVDAYVSVASGAACTPRGRDAVCTRWYYPAMFGIDPLRMLDHDFACGCQRSIVHTPSS